LDADVRFAVLGPVRAWRGTAEVELGSPQQRTTLAVLLLNAGRQVSMGELIEAVWGEAAPRAAVNTVRTYIYRLRRALKPGAGGRSESGDAVIVSAGDGYLLPIHSEALDLALFRQALTRAQALRRDGDLAGAVRCLREGLALWKGIALAGIRGLYADTQRTLLTELRLEAVEDRLEAELELGERGRVTAELSALVTQHPLRERLRELLMIGLYGSGRQAEALATYHDARRLLREELGVDPGPGLQAVHRRILGADPSLTGTPPLPAPPTAPPTPSQLPADLPDFIGREEILADLITSLTGTGVTPVIGITGLGGVGKTALAVHAAHVVRAEFPDGQVFVDLGATSDTPADPRAVLAFLLRVFGISGDDLPATLSERAAVWRSALAGRRVLIVLDDASDSAQIRDLMPATPGCVVIVTAARQIVDLPGVRWTRLDVLRPAEAVGLLGRIAGVQRVRAEADVAVRLAAVFSYLPLPVRFIGARLAARPHWTVAMLEERLCEPSGRPRLLGDHWAAMVQPLERSLRRLDAQQARALRLAAVPDGADISVAAAAAVLGMSEDDTDKVLESLVDVYLIEAGTPGRYWYHNLVRAFARRRAYLDDGPAECRAVIARLAEFSAGTAQNAFQTLGVPIPGAGSPGGRSFADAESARSWLTRERAFTLATIAQAQAQADPGTEAAVRSGLVLISRVLHQWSPSNADPERQAGR
jgi:DNA-binding SARP family transcriptional activator